jgi:isopentenyl-diphosphate delta-isomerase
VDFVDIGGRGGTNFIAIENMRGGTQIGEEMLSWGMPTAISLAEAVHFWPGRVIASGGIRNGLDIAKALAVGAELAGIAHPFLAACEEGPEAVFKLALSLIMGLRNIMFLLGACDVKTLKAKPVVITGYTREWLDQRGINTAAYAQRSLNEPCLAFRNSE